MVLVLRDPEQILKANGCTPCQAINPLEINDIRQTKPRQFDNVVLSSQHTNVVLSGQHWSECLYYQHGFLGIDIQLHCHGLTISLCVKIAAVWLDQLRKTAWLDMLRDFGWFGGTPHWRKLPYVCKMVYLGKPRIPRHHFLQRNAFGGHLSAKRLLSRGWWVLQGSCIPSEQGTEHRKQQIRKQPNRQALFLRSKYEYIVILRVFQALSKVTWQFFPLPWKMQDANMFAHGLSSSNCISERCL